MSDEYGARRSLHDLAAEAKLIATRHPLPYLERPVARRQRIAAERDPTGRGANLVVQRLAFGGRPRGHEFREVRRTARPPSAR